MIVMGITSFIKTRLLNNRVEQYNTKRSYCGEDERQPRTDGINTGLDLVDALPPVINTPIILKLSNTFLSLQIIVLFSSLIKVL